MHNILAYIFLINGHIILSKYIEIVYKHITLNLKRFINFVLK